MPLDLADTLDMLVPEGNKHKYRHDDEGDDDMPAHVKVGCWCARRTALGGRGAARSARTRTATHLPTTSSLGAQSSLMGPSLTLPIQGGRLALGTWQGIYLNEHRNYGGPRRIVITIQGRKRADGRRYSGYA